MDSIGQGKVLRSLFSKPFLNAPSAAFDYQFGALAKTDDEFMKAYFGLMYATPLYRNSETK